MLDRINGKVVLVTGGSRGIGKSISELFAHHGARVLMIYRSDAESAENTLKNLEGSGHEILKVDITQPKEIEDLWESLGNNGIQIDILVNNAGIAFHHPIDKVDYAEWQNGWSQIMNTNLTAAANMCYHASQHMIKNGGGKMINVSSRGAFRGEPLMPAYGASKAGLNAMAQSLAVQLAPYDIYVGVVAPGFVETEMSRPRLAGEVGKRISAQSSMNRVAQPKEVAEAVLLMAMSNMWMTGSIIDVNGASYLRS